MINEVENEQRDDATEGYVSLRRQGEMSQVMSSTI
jgi:hypothetical protein